MDSTSNIVAKWLIIGIAVFSLVAGALIGYSKLTTTVGFNSGKIIKLEENTDQIVETLHHVDIKQTKLMVKMGMKEEEFQPVD